MIYLILEESEIYRDYREGVFDSNKVIFVVFLKDVVSKLMTDFFEW